MAPKRKRNVISIYNKLELIQKRKKGQSLQQLADNYGIGTSTVSDIIKSASKLEKFTESIESEQGTKQRKSMKRADNINLENIIYEWFIQKRSLGEPISGPILMAKAADINTKIGGNHDFKATEGWLMRFKNRHGIRQLTLHGESLEADTDAANLFKTDLEEKIKRLNLNRDIVYNADETGLFWRTLPNKTLAARNEESAHVHKVIKERITVLVCANASGTHRLPLLIIGKSKKPRCFKNINMEALPVKYEAQKRA